MAHSYSRPFVLSAANSLLFFSAFGYWILAPLFMYPGLLPAFGSSFEIYTNYPRLWLGTAIVGIFPLALAFGRVTRPEAGANGGGLNVKGRAQGCRLLDLLL